MIAQIARAVFSDFPPGFYFVVATTGVILILAANTAFNGFPVLGSILAKDGFMRRASCGSRGDRLAYSNGILILAGFAMVLIIAFNAETTRLIQLYIIGVFVSFNLSQLGMIRHWTRHLKTEQDPARTAAACSGRGSINTFGLAMTATVFVIVLVTKFLAGAWIAILAMVIFFAILRSIRTHYDRVGEGAGDRRQRPGAADPGARDRAGLQAAQADDARAGLRQGHPAQRARGRVRRHRRRAARAASSTSGTPSGSTYP